MLTGTLCCVTQTLLPKKREWKKGGLMNDREVQREVRRLRRNLGKESAGEIAKLGLTRLLFGQAACDEEGKPVFDGFLTSKVGSAKAAE